MQFGDVDWIRVFLPAFLLLYVGICFVWRSVNVWRRTGRNPLVLGKSDNVYDYVGRLFKVSMGMAVVAVVLFSFYPKAYILLMPIDVLVLPGISAIGTLLLVGSFVWISIAQGQMQDSWRIGIDHQTQTELVDRGVFRRSRNPIFLGMIVTMFGLFLVIPNVLTLLVLVLGYVLIQIQVRLEEEYLKASHGQKYADYRSRVGRWIS